MDNVSCSTKQCEVCKYAMGSVISKEFTWKVCKVQSGDVSKYAHKELYRCPAFREVPEKLKGE